LSGRSCSCDDTTDDDRFMTSQDALMQVVDVDSVAPVEVGPRITRRTLPTTDRAREWVIGFAPGSEWPYVDVHDHEERYFVVTGEIIEGDHRFGAGSYVVFAPGSRHRPRSETGGRMLGINLS
jgi:ChrR Cupin-like domain